jgi:hypothetical protein
MSNGDELTPDVSLQTVSPKTKGLYDDCFFHNRLIFLPSPPPHGKRSDPEQFLGSADARR